MDAHAGIVVIGEPDQATSTLYERTLSAAYAVFAASDATMILDLLRGHEVAAVVLEPALFLTNRWLQLELVGYACSAAGVPLIICSTLDERRRGRELGAAVYLIKPTLPQTLLETLRQVIGSRAG